MSKINITGTLLAQDNLDLARTPLLCARLSLYKFDIICLP